MRGVAAGALAAGLLAAAPAAADDRRLKIRNGCAREPIWIAHEAAAATGPDKQNVKIEPNSVVDFATPAGLAATRYWPKMGCDESGGQCTLGGSGGPGESCVRRPPEVEKDDYSDCAPPVDTKFEGTFGSQALPCKDGIGVQGCDYVDMSLVDGWTLPFTLKVHGSCVSQKGITNELDIDCSGLTFDKCPGQELLSAAQGLVTDLRAKNPHTGQVAGCYAPCQKLIDGKWNNNVSQGRFGYDPAVAPYCCPTPPETPEACRAGPIADTQFLKTVHSRCPGVYGYAYDDGMGLLRCEPASIYELTFLCPDATTNFAATAAAMRQRQAAALAAAAEAKAKAAEREVKADAAVAEQEQETDAAAQLRARAQAHVLGKDSEHAAIMDQSLGCKDHKTLRQRNIVSEFSPPRSPMSLFREESSTGLARNLVVISMGLLVTASSVALYRRVRRSDDASRNEAQQLVDNEEDVLAQEEIATAPYCQGLGDAGVAGVDSCLLGLHCSRTPVVVHL